MEVVGAVASTLTIISLFKHTLKAFEVIDLYKHHHADFEKFELQLEIEQCRLFVWGEAMGLTDDSKANSLEHWRFSHLVRKCLAEIINLFTDAEKIRSDYGCQQITPNPAVPLVARERSTTSGIIAAAFEEFAVISPGPNTTEPRALATALRKSRWAIRDRKKFLSLVEKARGLIDSLRSITEELSRISAQEVLIKQRVLTIQDVKTLTMIAAACEKADPDIASVASIRADCISMSSGREREISEWQTVVDSVEPEDPNEITVASLESMTITELKHRIIELVDLQAKNSRAVATLDATEGTPRLMTVDHQMLWQGKSRPMKSAKARVLDSEGHYRTNPFASQFPTLYEEPDFKYAFDLFGPQFPTSYEEADFEYELPRFLTLYEEADFEYELNPLAPKSPTSNEKAHFDFLKYSSFAPQLSMSKEKTEFERSTDSIHPSELLLGSFSPRLVTKWRTLCR